MKLTTANYTHRTLSGGANKAVASKAKQTETKSESSLWDGVQDVFESSVPFVKGAGISVGIALTSSAVALATLAVAPALAGPVGFGVDVAGGVANVMAVEPNDMHGVVTSFTGGALSSALGSTGLSEGIMGIASLSALAGSFFSGAPLSEKG